MLTALSLRTIIVQWLYELTFPVTICVITGALYKCVAELGQFEVSNQLESAHQTNCYRGASGALPAYVIRARSTEHTKKERARIKCSIFEIPWLRTCIYRTLRANTSYMLHYFCFHGNGASWNTVIISHGCVWFESWSVNKDEDDVSSGMLRRVVW
jgi:hypothetical protein